MIQEIVVYIILTSVIAYSVFKIIKTTKPKANSGCEGCSGCEIKNEISKNTKTSSHKHSCNSVN